MLPSARLLAAIGILDRVLAGTPAEQALTNWGRASRYAGSGDRAAVRDLVFDAIRCRRSFAALGGSETGRGLVLGGLRAAGIAADALFTGQGHAPAPVGPQDPPPLEPEGLVALDCPEWLAPDLGQSLGTDFAAVMAALRHRAPVFLRANLTRTTRAAAKAALALDGIAAIDHPLASSALQVTDNARKIQKSRAYADGLVELQDAASQAVVEELAPPAGARVLDFCAGGGGKSLALAALGAGNIFAHDANQARMRDLPARARRAGARIEILAGADVDRAAPFDLVLADVPCSGSGSWRRAPEAKWTLTRDRLDALVQVQAEILERVQHLVGPNGRLAYVTCSLLDVENAGQVADFLDRNPGWRLARARRLTPLDGADGFYLALLDRA